jgi:hypothetical protein
LAKIPERRRKKSANNRQGVAQSAKGVGFRVYFLFIALFVNYTEFKLRKDPIEPRPLPSHEKALPKFLAKSSAFWILGYTSSLLH